MRPLDPNELLSSSTTILDAVEIFGSQSNEYFYIIHTNKIIGVMFYRTFLSLSVVSRFLRLP